MALKKGDVINPSGRPKGAANKTTSEIRQAFQQLVSNNIDKLQDDLNSIVEPEKRIALIIKLSEFFLPKLQSLTIENQLEIEYKKLESLLLKADDVSLEIISQKVIEITNTSNNN